MEDCHIVRPCQKYFTLLLSFCSAIWTTISLKTKHLFRSRDNNFQSHVPFMKKDGLKGASPTHRVCSVTTYLFKMSIFLDFSSILEHHVSCPFHQLLSLGLIDRLKVTSRRPSCCCPSQSIFDLKYFQLNEQFLWFQWIREARSYSVRDQ